MDKLNYQQAKGVRNTSLKDLIADELIRGKGIGGAIGGAISLRTQARVKGIKEKFDPLNIVKFLTFGSRLGPALYGRLFGRSRKDIEYFTGRAKAIGSREKRIGALPSTSGEDTTGMKAVLNQILTFLNKSHEDDMILREKENNLRESNKLADDRRHKDLLKALGANVKTTGTATKVKESGNGFLSGILSMINDLKNQLTSFIDGIKDVLEFSKNLFSIFKSVGISAAFRILGLLGNPLFLAAAIGVATLYGVYKLLKDTEKEKEELAAKGDVQGLQKKIEDTQSGEAQLYVNPDDEVRYYLNKAAKSGAEPAKQALTDIEKKDEGLRPKTEKRFLDEYMNSKRFYDNTGNKNYKNMLTGERPDKKTWDEAQAYADKKMADNNLMKQGNQVPGQRNATYDPRRLDTQMPKVPEPTIVTPPVVNQPPKSEVLNTVTKENVSLNLPSNTTDKALQDASVNKVINTPQRSGSKKIPIPSVRNLEDSFQRMIINSTRVV